MGDDRELRGAVAFCHLLLRQRVQPGDRVVDATCGNGGDTLLLAELVGATGRVWALDLQPRAVAKTAERLAAAGLADRVELLTAGHERLATLVPAGLKAVVFNLGYLPGGDRDLVTRGDNTLSAVGQVLELLLPGGLLLVAVYTGHPGGAEEAAALTAWAESLEPSAWHAWSCRQSNRSSQAPYLLLVEKAGTGC